MSATIAAEPEHGLSLWSPVPLLPAVGLGCAQASTPSLILHPAPHRQPATPTLHNLPWLPIAWVALRPGLGGGGMQVSDPGSVY